MAYLNLSRAWGNFEEFLGTIYLRYKSETFIHEHLYVSFLTKLVILNLKLYRASYAQHNLYWLEQGTRFKGLLLKFITPLFQVQWPYNLCGWKALNV